MKVSIQVKPGSKKGPLVEVLTNNKWVVYVREPATDGRANEAMIEAIAKRFDITKSRISIKSGHTARYKIVEIDD